MRVAAPPVEDAPLAAADVALRAPVELGVPLRTLRAHRGARLAFAIAPAYLKALDAAARGDSSLKDATLGKASAAAPSTDALLALLSRHRPLDPKIARSAAGARYLTLATAAANELAGQRSAPFSAADVAQFAALDMQIVAAGAGSGPPGAAASPRAALAALQRADRAVADELRADVHAGTVELIALPDAEPVLPLLVDAGGQTKGGPRIVQAGASADAAWLVHDAVRAAASLARSGAAGVYSPYGAYDDSTAAIIKSAGAAYAVFSDRVVRGIGAEGSEGGVDAAGAASLHAYSLTLDKGVTMPVLFWSETASAQLQAAIGASDAMGSMLVDLAHAAAARASQSTPSILVVRIDADGPWAQRPDAPSVAAAFVEAIASGRAGAATTPGAFVRAHPPAATAYGYPPRTESGTFGLWMGAADQASLWNALAAARKAAGGDAALARPDLRPLIFAAESGSWYSGIATQMGGKLAADRLDRFRALIARIYRATGAAAPAQIAPIAAATRAPLVTPSASPTPVSLPSPPGV